MKILCLLTSYKRNDKALRFLSQFDSSFRSYRDFLDVYIADDDPDSSLSSFLDELNIPLNVFYSRNDFNYGQGPNAVQAIKKNLHYDYIWCPGDDDCFDANELCNVLNVIRVESPTVAIMEFRQGPNLSHGTFFEGQSRFISNIVDAIDASVHFGKCSSTIFRTPPIHFIEYVETSMVSSMYQDKAFCVASLISDYPESFAYLHTAPTVMGDSQYGLLRYSTRVFRNLSLTVDKTVDYFSSLHHQELDLPNYLSKDSHNAFYWWLFGIKCQLNRRSMIRYSKKKFLLEMLLGPFYVVWYDFIVRDFQPR